MIAKINVSKYLPIKEPVKVEMTAEMSKKVYEISATVTKLVSMAQHMSKLKFNLQNASEVSEAFDEMANSITSCENFLAEMLKLSSKNANELGKMSEDNLYAFALNVVDQYSKARGNDISKLQEKTQEKG